MRCVESRQTRRTRFERGHRERRENGAIASRRLRRLRGPRSVVYRLDVALRWVVVVSVFLLFAEDTETIYGHYWAAPMGWLHAFFYAPVPYKIRPLDHILALCLALAPKGASVRVPAMRNALLIAAGTVVLWFVYGLLTGGDARAASWQVYMMLSAILFAFCIGAVFRTPEDFALLAKALLAAAAYRAMMCWLFYFIYIRPMRVLPFPEYLTAHDDTVLWVTAIVILAVRMVDAKTMGGKARAGVFMAFLLGAIQFNTRRLAWVSLALGLLVAVVLWPPGRQRRRLFRTGLMVAPIVLLYVIVGWGRSESVFKPLRAFATMSTQEDASTKARNVENLGLIATAKTNWLFGTGWGHPYIAVSDKYSIAQYFELWPYVPHNSILGLLAYTGVCGFLGYWLAFPTAMFLNARTAQLGRSPLARRVALVGAAEMLICANQYFGDMGIFFTKSTYILAGSYAIALRLPIEAGVWPSPKARRKLKGRSVPPPPPAAPAT